jgi:tetratricopeptide (TPR) repeat protein
MNKAYYGATGLPYNSMVEGPAPIFIVNIILTALAYGTAFYLYFWNPVGYVFFTVEDSWVEWATVAAFFMVSAIMIWGIVRYSDLRRPVPIIIAVVALLVAAEEINWGQRIFGFATPEVLKNANWQAETNLHNLLTFGPHALAGPLIILWMMIGHPLCRRMPKLSVCLERLSVPLLPVRVWPIFFLAAMFLIYPPFVRINFDEIAELYLGLALIILVFDLIGSKHKVLLYPRVYIASVTVSLVAFFAITFVLIAITPKLPPIKAEMNRYAAFRFPTKGGLNQAAQIFEYILEHEELIANDTRYNYGLILKQMGQEEKARDVLQEVLDETALHVDDIGKNIDSIRIRAMTLLLLDHKTEAHLLFQKILKRDLKRLTRASKARKVSRLNWSIAKTLYAMGNVKEASLFIERACQTAPNNITGNHVRRWKMWQDRRIDSFRSLDY